MLQRIRDHTHKLQRPRGVQQLKLVHPPSVTRASAGERQVQDADRLKADLLQLVTRLNTEILEDDARELQEMRALVEELAQLNPTPQPALSPLINGRWVLLFTIPSSGPDGVERSPLQRALAEAYNFFFKYVPVIAGSAVGRKASARSSGVTARGNFQTFDTAAGFVGNQARFEVFGRPGRIDVDGIAAVVQDHPEGARIEATFTSAELRWGDGVRLEFPIRLFSPRGWIDTIYLDQELRVSCGDKGSVFIARRAALPAAAEDTATAAG